MGLPAVELILKAVADCEMNSANWSMKCGYFDLSNVLLDIIICGESIR